MEIKKEMYAVMSTKKRLLLTGLFFLSLSPMFLSQFGGLEGIRELPGLIALTTPIGFFAFLFVLMGFWCPFASVRTNRVLCAIGLPGIVLSELYTCLTWHDPTAFSLQESLRGVFPAFWVGIAASCLMVLVYVVLLRGRVSRSAG